MAGGAGEGSSIGEGKEWPGIRRTGGCSGAGEFMSVSGGINNGALNVTVGFGDEVARDSMVW